MSKYLFIALILISGAGVTAQTPDSVFAVHKNSVLYIKHQVKAGEDMQMLATRFYLAPSAIESANDADVLRRFTPGSYINIPIVRENFYINKQNFRDLHELYYRWCRKMILPC